MVGPVFKSETSFSITARDNLLSSNFYFSIHIIWLIKSRALW